MAAVQFYLPYDIAIKPTNVGAPGAKLYVYAYNTTTLRPVYSTSALTTQLTNPVIADGAGKFPAIYLNSALSYKIVITDKAGATLFTKNPYIPGSAPDAAALAPYQAASEAAATAAASSASAASTSATAAAASASSASTSATSASTNATAAAASASAAAASAANAEAWAALTSLDYALTFVSAGSAYIPAQAAMTLAQGTAAIGTGTLAYAKSTAAAPSTFTDTTLPVALEAGAWLRVTATGVSGFVATQIVRTV